jgi:transcription antitermination factor NusG
MQMQQILNTGIPSHNSPASVFQAAPADSSLTRRWYAVYTYPQHEKGCVKQLSQRGLEVFLPTCAQDRVWKNRQRVQLQVPLFPSYVFVQMAAGERGKVLGAPAVLRILGNGAGPQPIPDGVVDLLRAEPFRNRLHREVEITVGQKVRIRNGAMQGVEGVLVRKKNSLWFVLSIELISQRATIEVQAEDIECLSN